MSINCKDVLKKYGYSGETVIGAGSYSQVLRVWSEARKQHLAAKVIQLNRLKDEIRETFLPREIRILRMLKHPNVIETLEVIEEKHWTLIIQEYATGGTLLDIIHSYGSIRERLTKPIFRQIIQALHYLHTKSLVHRDVKTENILLDGYGNVKLGDFGFSVETGREKPLKSFCGSPGYAAPEILTETPYWGFASDIWSAGIVLYVILTSILPFKGFQSLSHQIPYPDSVEVSDKCKKLISRLLEPVPAKRAKHGHIINSEWLKDTPWTIRKQRGIDKASQTETGTLIQASVGVHATSHRNTQEDASLLLIWE